MIQGIWYTNSYKLDGVECPKTYTIFDAIASLPNNIILEIKKLESGMDLGDKCTDLERTRVVTQGYGIDGQTGLLSGH